MGLFFTSDTHFGDHRTINIHKRPFASAAAMDAALIAAWNQVVGPGDVIWHLGDFARSAPAAEALLAQLNGSKHLVTGNNDPAGTRVAAGWESVADYVELDAESRKLVLCHYPFRSWNGQAKGAINLHGHSHGRMKPLPRQVDVGVDAWEFRPVSLAQLFARVGVQTD
jgi:calcineurin-like phosphoesterase family protein